MGDVVKLKVGNAEVASEAAVNDAFREFMNEGWTWLTRNTVDREYGDCTVQVYRAHDGGWRFAVLAQRSIGHVSVEPETMLVEYSGVEEAKLAAWPAARKLRRRKPG